MQLFTWCLIFTLSQTLRLPKSWRSVYDANGQNKTSQSGKTIKASPHGSAWGHTLRARLVLKVHGVMELKWMYLVDSNRCMISRANNIVILVPDQARQNKMIQILVSDWKWLFQWCLIQDSGIMWSNLMPDSFHYCPVTKTFQSKCKIRHPPPHPTLSRSQ